MSNLSHITRKIIALPGSEKQCVELDVPARGVIRTLIIAEEVGPKSGFAFDIFSKREVCPPTLDEEGSETSSQSSSGDTAARVLYSVTGRQSTGTAVFEAREKTWPFETEGGPTNRSRKLYMEIDPAGADAAREYEIRIDVELPVV